MQTVWVLALVALLATFGDAILDDVITVTMRALHGNENHNPPCEEGISMACMRVKVQI